MLKVEVSRTNPKQVKIMNDAIKKIRKIEPAWISIFQNSIDAHLTTGKPLDRIVRKEIKAIRKLQTSNHLPPNSERLFSSFVKAYAITHFGLSVK